MKPATTLSFAVLALVVMASYPVFAVDEVLPHHPVLIMPVGYASETPPSILSIVDTAFRAGLVWDSFLEVIDPAIAERKSGLGALLDAARLDMENNFEIPEKVKLGAEPLTEEIFRELTDFYVASVSVSGFSATGQSCSLGLSFVVVDAHGAQRTRSAERPIRVKAGKGMGLEEALFEAIKNASCDFALSSFGDLSEGPMELSRLAEVVVYPGAFLGTDRDPIKSAIVDALEEGSSECFTLFGKGVFQRGLFQSMPRGSDLAALYERIEEIRLERATGNTDLVSASGEEMITESYLRDCVVITPFLVSMSPAGDSGGLSTIRIELFIHDRASRLMTARAVWGNGLGPDPDRSLAAAVKDLGEEAAVVLMDVIGP